MRIKDYKGRNKLSVSSDLHEFLMRCREKILEEDSMVLGILWGEVGSGKSLKAQHMGVVVDPTLDKGIDKKSIERIGFDHEEFIDAVIKYRQSAVIGDEGITLFFSRKVMTKEGRLISELMNQIRQKNLFVIICVPNLLTIDATILESANFVGYVWESTKEIGGREVKLKGNLALYPKLDGDNSKDRIIQHLKIKKSKPNYYKSPPEPFLREPGNPIGETFKKPWYPVGQKKYLEKKESILIKYKEKEEKIGVLDRKRINQRDSGIKALKRITGMTERAISAATGIPRGTINEILATRR